MHTLLRDSPVGGRSSPGLCEVYEIGTIGSVAKSNKI